MQKKSTKILCVVLLFATLFTFSLSISSADTSLERANTSPEYMRAGNIEVKSRLLELLGEGSEEASAGERIYLIPGGEVFGTKIKETHITVVDGKDSKELAAGDKIISANGKEITAIGDLSDIIHNSGGERVKISIERDGRCFDIDVTPKLIDGKYKIGVTLRDVAAGIGTVTYINPKTGEFGGLGHGIYDAGGTLPIETSGGVITDVILGAVKRGEAGCPGELTGILTDRTAGVIYTNTDVGIFGKFSSLPKNLDTPLPIAYKSEVKCGEATVISTLKNGKRMEYKIEISDIDITSSGTKSFKVKVTDPALLAISGGIVRGMSGSTILQDGKIVGALTHVMVNDPARGYGIFIENMLAKSSTEQRKAA